MPILIAFRGRNTSSILTEANEAIGAVTNPEILIVCRNNDNFAEPGDLTPREAIYKLSCMLAGKDPEELPKVVLIANGGTTAQQVPLILFLSARWDGWRGAYSIIELDRNDGLVTYADHPSMTLMDKPAGCLEREEADELFNGTSW